jgi:hypothetical protein
MSAPFTRMAVMGGGQDARRFMVLCFILIGSILALTIIPLAVFLVRFIRYQRRHPWTPPAAADAAAGVIRPRSDRIPQALHI